MKGNNKEKSKLQFYHYLSEDDLNSFYAQCGDFVVERIRKLENEGNIDADAKIEIGKLLSMIGLGGIEVGGKISLKRLKSESLKSIFKVEQSIPVILRFLEVRGQLSRLTPDSKTAKDGYVLFVGTFFPPNFDEVARKSIPSQEAMMAAALSGKREFVKPQGFVQFLCPARFGNITMGTSLAKYVTGLQHLIVMWNGAVRLSVFGHLTELPGARGFYLKPFAIAQA
jgi:hypothetical protein